MKIFLVVVVVLIALVASYVAWASLVANPRVIRELETDPASPRADKAMVLYLPDGKTIPVNYLMEGNQVFAGSDFGWWRALQSGGVPVKMTIRARQYAGTARVELEDKVYVEDVFSRLRPTVPAFLTHWGKLVVIDDVKPAGPTDTIPAE